MQPECCQQRPPELSRHYTDGKPGKRLPGPVWRSKSTSRSKTLKFVNIAQNSDTDAISNNVKQSLVSFWRTSNDFCVEKGNSELKETHFDSLGLFLKPEGYPCFFLVAM